MIPTLTLAAEKDGQYRIFRNAEAYWHQVYNINPEQKGDYPVVVIKGASHGSFMLESMLPSTVQKADLKPEISEDQAQ